MLPYEIIRHPRYQEIHVGETLSLGLFSQILRDLVQADGFLGLHALWAFPPDSPPPPFHEFEGVVRLLEKVYTRRPAAKRVALAVPDPFGRSVAEVFRAQAGRLPVDLRVFDSVADARAWIED